MEMWRGACTFTGGSVNNKEHVKDGEGSQQHGVVMVNVFTFSGVSVNSDEHG